MSGVKNIKFRAWNKLEKRMESVNSIKFFLNAYTMVSTRYRDEKSKKIYDDQFAYGQEDGSDNVILMQYTGLKDKHGKEIYEGDIVELVNTYKGMNTKSIVEIAFIDFTFAGKWKSEYSPSGYMYNPLCSYNFPIVTIEVIGNIYENPELLK